MLVIESIDGKQKKKIAEELNNVNGIKVRDGADKNPCMVIGGLLEDVDERQILESNKKQNE